MGAYPANRKYPRADVNQPGVLTVRIPEQRLAHRVPVAIRSISPEGMGVAVSDPRLKLEQRTTVTMHFDVDGKHFEIPGQVVWVGASPGSARTKPGAPASAVDLGVRFQLALAPLEMRQSYAHWIVNLLRKQAATPGPTTTRQS